MKSSKHVETCFVRANNDFDAKLTAFWMKKKFWTKIPKNGHCGYDGESLNQPSIILSPVKLIKEKS